MNISIALLQAGNEGTGGIRGILQRVGEGAIKLVESLTGAEQPTTTVYVDRTNPVNTGLVVLLVVACVVATISIYKNVQYRAIVKDLDEEKKEEKKQGDHA